MNFISARELKQRLDEGQAVFLLDIRENYERAVCSIPSSHIPMAEVCDRISELPDSQVIVIMCRSGKRAEAVANILETDHKIANILVLEGGLLSWIETVDQTLEIN